jgi:hypothetical protein
MKSKHAISAVCRFFILIVVCVFTPPLWAASASEITGTYELTGVMEMAGALRIMPDQKYMAQFSYGAADWIEEGNWKWADSHSIVLSNARFKLRNTNDISLLLPSGTRFIYAQGKLTAYGPGGHIIFINPNKTPSGHHAPGEGRMRVRGTVVTINSEILEVKTKECIDFDVNGLSEEVIRTAKKSKQIDVEIPYSAIISSSSHCSE